jgi:hypothetical protein
MLFKPNPKSPSASLSTSFSGNEELAVAILANIPGVELFGETDFTIAVLLRLFLPTRHCVESLLKNPPQVVFSEPLGTVDTTSTAHVSR